MSVTSIRPMLGLRWRREKQTRYLSQAIQLEEAVNPHILRATMSMIALAIFLFIIWAGFTTIHEVARTPGEVVPHGYQQTVQHLEGGIVMAIHVQEGQLVEQDQVLLTLQDNSVKEDLDRIRSKQLSLAMAAERLRAFVEGRPPDFTAFADASEQMIVDQMAYFAGMKTARSKEEQLLHDQMAERKQSLNAVTSELDVARKNYRLTSEVYRRRLSLYEKGYASHIKILEDQQKVNDLKGTIKRLETQFAVAEKEIGGYENKLASLTARHRDEAYEKLSRIEAERAQNAEMVEKLSERIGRLDVRAPSRGLVKGLSVNTIGSVVTPGQTLMEIVPLNKTLEVQVKIAPRDIGHVQPGQAVRIKFSSYDFSRYGFVPGKLEQISATTFGTEGGERYYQGRITLDRPYVGNDTKNLIMPGMTVMADIITGKKTILQYLLKPIHLSLQTAFSER